MNNITNRCEFKTVDDLEFGKPYVSTRGIKGDLRQNAYLEFNNKYSVLAMKICWRGAYELFCFRNNTRIYFRRFLTYRLSSDEVTEVMIGLQKL